MKVPRTSRVALFSALLAFSSVLAASAPAPNAEVLIERTFLPFGAAPSSFAIGLPDGVNFCFDPVRDGVSYAWTGGFIDLASVRSGMDKRITEARLLGPVVYREDGPAPLRRGDSARPPIIEFKGYALQDDAVEVHYTLDGVSVREEIRARAGGDGLSAELVLAYLRATFGEKPGNAGPK
ncbi:MAG: hypothetical protein HY736_09165 [Verrucomicrobia bacterium]|nr:hypothetical protein [Verrucomicrobiota bacterium]